jgi:hypothetical protein
VDLLVSLRDGGSPVSARGEVVWVREGGPEEPGGMAVRFLGLDESSALRITRLVADRTREPESDERRAVRIRLPGLPSALRAVARDLTSAGVTLEAELPWLRLGSSVSTEVSPGMAKVGSMRWVGIDVAHDGTARLRISVDFAAGAPDERFASSAQVPVVVEPGERPAAPAPSAPPAVAAREPARPPPRKRRRWRLLLGAAVVGVLGTLTWRMVGVPPRRLEIAPPQVLEVPPDLSLPAASRVIPKEPGADASGGAKGHDSAQTHRRRPRSGKHDE